MTEANDAVILLMVVINLLHHVQITIRICLLADKEGEHLHLLESSCRLKCGIVEEANCGNYKEVCTIDTAAAVLYFLHGFKVVYDVKCALGIAALEQSTFD